MSFCSSPNKEDVDLNIETSTGKSPLLLAFGNSDKTLDIKLIEQGANVDCHDVENIMPLHHAAYRGKLGEVDLLLQKGADPDVTTPWGSTALLIACARGHEDVAELLSKYSKRLDWVTEECNSTTFHLDQPPHWTALHFASCCGWLKVVKLLAERGANLNIKDSEGRTPFSVAFAYRREDVAELLIDLGATCGKNKWTILHFAAAHDWLSLVESVVKKGAELDVKTARGMTPLLLAAERDNWRVMSFLIEKGADIESCNSEGHTVLWFALRNRWLRVFELLADRGVDFDEEMPCGDIPVLMAASNANKEVVQSLIKFGVDLKCNDRNGWTILHYASLHGWPDIARSAVEGGCDVNAVNWSGNTPLHIVCDFSRSPNTELTSEAVEIVELLIENGADVDVKNSHAETPLYLASKYLQYPDIGSRGLLIFNCLLSAQCRG